MWAARRFLRLRLYDQVTGCSLVCPEKCFRQYMVILMALAVMIDDNEGGDSDADYGEYGE